MNEQYSINENSIKNKELSLNDLEQQLAKSNDQIGKLNNERKDLTIKLEKDTSSINIAQNTNLKNSDLKKSYEDQIAVIDKKIDTLKKDSNQSA